MAPASESAAETSAGLRRIFTSTVTQVTPPPPGEMPRRLRVRRRGAATRSQAAVRSYQDRTERRIFSSGRDRMGTARGY